MLLIDPVSVPRLAERYPHAPGRLSHFLAAEPLLGSASLAYAARVLPSHQIERRSEHDGADDAADRAADSGPDPAEIIAAGGPERGSIVIHAIEQLRPYRRLVDRLLAELAPVIARATGRMHEPTARVILTAPGAPTPFHFDNRYNILFQLSGDKVIAAYPATPPFLDLDRREACLAGEGNRLAWNPSFAAQGEQHLLSPGEALFLPHAAPHWVRAGMGASVALSLTWQCRASRRLDDALALNPVARRIGLAPYDPAAAPAPPPLRAVAGRIGRSLNLL
ncbi:hypothetical protein [Porphyrobacter sp. LM 6]|uniref:hypothetical protein n=1 Tax=Porphyrobacter sp. LM 6 TaxID=1896196 RepID=UPI00084774CD|nr:hypothetical protein [Porphyrobacter sp. LM 6]AOL93731.1 hypothetical protein BG023_11782 [Porphyrobacter sp. LM 6]